MALVPQLNQTDVTKATEQKLLQPQQWMAFVITGGKAQVNERNGNFELQFSFAPLTNPDDPQSKAGPLFHDRTSLPVTNHEFVDEDGENSHTAPDTLGLLDRVLTAIYGVKSDEIKDGIPAKPKRVANQWTYDGEAIGLEALETAKQEQASAVIQKGIELYTQMAEGDACPVAEYVVYGKIRHNASGNGRTYQNWDELVPELPPRATLVTDKTSFKFKG